MGNSGFAMPLLSTLAALVIIVHSTEEDFRGDYRHDLRPRVLDTGAQSHEQPWRAVEADDVIKHPGPHDSWSSVEEPPKRRRPVRKRKRRPLQPPGEDLVPQERYLYDNAPRPYHEVSPRPYHEDTTRHNDNDRLRSRDELHSYHENPPHPYAEKYPHEDQQQESYNIRTRHEEDPLPSHDVERHHEEERQPSHKIKAHYEDERLPSHDVKPDEDRQPLRDVNTRYGEEAQPSNSIGVHNEEEREPSSNDRTHHKEELQPQSEHTTEHAPDVLVTEEPRRRRKKPENRRNRWTEEFLDGERPKRRRGNRRKRPTLEEWPRLSEFDTFRPQQSQEAPIDINEDDIAINFKEKNNKQAKAHRNLEIIRDEEIYEEPKELLDTGIHETKSETDLGAIIPNPPKEEYYVQQQTDDSLSEFSMEEIRPSYSVDQIQGDTYNNNKYKEKASIIDKMEKIEDQAPTKPDKTLKEILKRSNGTSLSELLQQNNVSLADLLRGKERAVSLLKLEENLETVEHNRGRKRFKTQNVDNAEKRSEKTNVYEQDKVENETTDKEPETTTIQNELITETVNQETNSTNQEDKPIISEISELPKENTKEKPRTIPEKPKISTRRRFPGGIRRKLRMKPIPPNGYKGQLNRDILALTARKYFNHNRNVSKSREWRNVISSMMNNRTVTNITIDAGAKTEKIDQKDQQEENVSTTTSIPDETTSVQYTDFETKQTIAFTDAQTEASTKYTEPDTNTETTQISTTTDDIPVEIIISSTEMPKVHTSIRPTINRMGLRRQALNNRLKKKRLKQKSSTTGSPQDDFMTDLFGMANLVSSSEFIAKTQTAKPTTKDDQDIFTTLEDFMTTAASTIFDNEISSTRGSTTEYLTTSKPTTMALSTTEEAAKIEIEEIFKDTRTGSKLSKILMERNMTLSELVEHRERGSSHVHLADIFHNASKEPNPPEPFLSKSLIEPISKETYPLRALLDANLHDTTVKATTLDPYSTQTQHIPVVMDFKNNVNENGENMGIISMFNQYADNVTSTESGNINEETETTATTFLTSTASMAPKKMTMTNETTRESRVLKDEDMNKGLISWKDLFEIMRRNRKNESEKISSKGSEVPEDKKITLEKDADGDGVIVLEDLQHLKESDSQIAPAANEKLEVMLQETTNAPGILDKFPGNTKSVTVATASIVGLAMILFLLTYAVFKWRQQRSMLRKKHSFCDENIPTPVFESRKGHKNNCSMRSISPMLTSSNIYSLNTLESLNDKDSPDYSWDSLRKPFQ